MSAAEVIEPIKKLPPEERAEGREFGQTEEPAPEGGRTIRHLPQAEAEQISEEIFKDHAELFRRLAQ